MKRLFEFIKGLIALLAILVLLVGVPFALVVLSANRSATFDGSQPANCCRTTHG